MHPAKFRKLRTRRLCIRPFILSLLLLLQPAVSPEAEASLEFASLMPIDKTNA